MPHNKDPRSQHLATKEAPTLKPRHRHRKFSQRHTETHIHTHRDTQRHTETHIHTHRDTYLPFELLLASPFYFQEFIRAIITPPSTPNKFWGFNKCNSQKRLDHPVLSLFLGGKITQSFTPKYSQGINWRNKFHLGCTRKFLGN